VIVGVAKTVSVIVAVIVFEFTRSIVAVIVGVPKYISVIGAGDMCALLQEKIKKTSKTATRMFLIARLI
jgi:hypothetical protein